MKQISILSSFMMILFIFSSCVFMGPSIKGNGNVVEEVRKTNDFNKIEVSRGMNVYISQGEFSKVLVKADENLMDAIETITDGDVLIIRATKNIRSATSKKVFITTPQIEAIKSSSGSNIFSETKLECKNLDLSTSSGSNMTLQLNAENLEASASSGSNIKLQTVSENVEASASSGSNIRLEGNTSAFTGKATSGSNIKAEELTSVTCEAKASGGANIWITAKNNFSGDVSSGANIFLYGNPGNTNIEKSSGGNIINK